MEEILCLIGFVFLIIFAVVVGISNAMAKMPPKSKEENSGMPFGIAFKNDANDDDSWVGK